MDRSFGLTTLLAFLVLVVWTFIGISAGHAQVIDADPCQKECNREHARCVDTCGDDDNPEECDAQCNEDWQDCLQECD